MALGRSKGVIWSEETVRIGATPVHRVGHGDKRALMVHGWAGSSRQYRRIAQSLVEVGYTVFIPDLPAHGEAEGTSTDVPEMIAALSDIGTELGRFDLVVAHSLGAMATGVAMAEDGLAAERLVLVAPGIEPNRALGVFSVEIGLTVEAHERVVHEMERRFGTDVWDRIPASISQLDPPALSIVIHDADDDRTDIAMGRNLADTWSRPFIETVGYGHNGVLRSDEGIAAITALATTDAPVTRTV